MTLDEVEVRRNFGDSCVVGNGRRFERKERNGLLFSPDQDGELFIKYIYSNLIFRISRNSSKIEFSSRGFRLISRESEKIKKYKFSSSFSNFVYYRISKKSFSIPHISTWGRNETEKAEERKAGIGGRTTSGVGQG